MEDNVVIAILSDDTKFTVRTESLCQYDYGQVLAFDGVELPDTFEVHFSNDNDSDSALAVLGEGNMVAIPDELLLTGEPVYVWIFLHTGEDDGETEYQIIIPVVRKAKPSDMEPTPVQQDIITQTIAKLNVAVEKWENITAKAEALDPDAEVTVSYSDGVLTIGIPEPRAVFN